MHILNIVATFAQVLSLGHKMALLMVVEVLSGVVRGSHSVHDMNSRQGGAIAYVVVAYILLGWSVHGMLCRVCYLSKCGRIRATVLL